MVKPVALALAVIAAACQGRDDGRAGRGSGPASGSVAIEPRPDSGGGFGTDAHAEDAAIFAVDDAGPGSAVAASDARLDEPEPPDPGKLIAELGAIPAWQAVVDRAQLLGRRDQHGVVYGRIGPPILVPAPPPATPVDAGAGPPIDAGMVPSPYVWLVDDTEGNGSLGIRVALGTKTANQGDRVALGGAWHLDEARRWYWKVDSLQPLPPAPPSDLKDPPWPEPTHAIPNGNLPYGARTITVARDGDAVFFQIVGPPPANEGDGWLVADELGDKPFALLTLPGERPAYGGQDMRSPDERWQLKKAQTYWVRIGKIRRRDDPDKPALIHARTGPVRVK